MSEGISLRITARDDSSTVINGVRQNIRRMSDEATTGVSAMMKYGGALKGIVAGAAVTGLVALGKNALDTMDRVDELSQMTGVATDTLQAFGYAAKFSGLGLEDVGKAIGKLSRNVYDAASGTGDAAKAFTALGISVKNADGTLRSSEDVMGDIAQRFQEMEDGTGKTALAMKLFGKSGAEMIPFLNQGREGIAKLTNEARQFGLIMDKDAIKRAADFADNLDKLSAIGQGFANKVMANLIPTFQKWSDEILNASKNTDILEQSAKNAGTAIESVAEKAKTLFQIGSEIPSDLYEAGAYGIVGKFLFGNKAGALIAMLTLVNEQAHKTMGYGLQDLVKKNQGATQSFQNIFDALTGKRDWRTGEWKTGAIGVDYEPHGFKLESPDKKKPAPFLPDEGKIKQYASIMEAWSAKMRGLVNETAALYQDDLTKAIMGVEAKAAEMYVEADKHAKEHGITLDTSIIASWQEAMIAHLKYQDAMKSSEALANNLAAAAERSAGIERALVESAQSRFMAQASGLADVNKGYIDIAESMGVMTAAEAIEARYAIELALVEKEWERLSALALIANTEEEIQKLSAESFALKQKEVNLAQTRSLDLSRATADTIKAQRDLAKEENAFWTSAIAHVMDFRDTMGEALFDWMNGSLKKASSYWDSFFTSLKKRFAETVSDMIMNWALFGKASGAPGSGSTGQMGGLMGMLQGFLPGGSGGGGIGPLFGLFGAGATDSGTGIAAGMGIGSEFAGGLGSAGAAAPLMANPVGAIVAAVAAATAATIAFWPKIEPIFRKIGNAVEDIFGSMLDMMGDFMKSAGKGIGSAAKGVGGFFSSAIKSVGKLFSSIFHEGGMVGYANVAMRAVSPMLFAGAPRLHEGLMPNEFPAILERGEVVIPRRQVAQASGARGQTVVQHYHLHLNNQGVITTGNVEKWLSDTMDRVQRRRVGTTYKKENPAWAGIVKPRGQ